MGSKLSAIINRLFDYPIKRKPICFHRQEDFTSTGEPISGSENVAKEPPTEYDKLVETFYSRLLSQRKHAKEMQEKNKQWSVQKILKKFPGWNEMTISNLHSLFLLFDNQKTGMLSYPDFCAVLESLGDSTTADLRKQKFDNADIDSDGWITYDEFLALLYNFTPPSDGELAGVAKLCYDIAENYSIDPRNFLGIGYVLSEKLQIAFSRWLTIGATMLSNNYGSHVLQYLPSEL